MKGAEAMDCSFAYYVHKVMKERFIEDASNVLYEEDGIVVDEYKTSDNINSFGDFNFTFRGQSCNVAAKDMEILDFFVRLDVTADIVDGPNIGDMYEGSVYLRYEAALTDLDNAVLTYSGKTAPNFPYVHMYSDQLVPRISYSRYDEVAQNILLHHGYKLGEAPDAFELANRMGLDIVTHRMTPDGKVKGRMVFHECQVDHYDEDGNKEAPRIISGKTILVDPSVFDYKYGFAVLYNTVFHEIVHWYLHRHTVKLLELCYESKFKFPKDFNTDDLQTFQLAEKQARAIAARLHMPAIPFKKRADQIVGIHSHSIVFIELAINQLKEEFHTSRTAARIRMIECGYHIARGVYQWMDGSYVPSFKVTSPEDEIGITETFVISDQDYRELLRNNEFVSELVKLKVVLYVEHHLVLNIPEALEKDVYTIELSKEARSNIQKYCLKFSVDTTTRFPDYDTVMLDDEKMLFLLNRKVDASVFKLSPAKDQGEFYEHYSTNFKDVFAEKNKLSACETFGDGLKEVMEWAGFTQEKLEEYSKISVSKISRLRNNGNKPNIQTIVILSVAMSLPYALSSVLLDLANFSLNQRGNNPLFEYLLESAQSVEMNQCFALMDEYLNN